MAEDELSRNPAEAIRKILVERYGSSNVRHDVLDAAARICDDRMTPLERGARALCEKNLRNVGRYKDDALPEIVDAYWPGHVDSVRAVLKAIREPSEGMVKAGGDSVEIDMIPLGGSAETVWQAMIDAMLAEKAS